MLATLLPDADTVSVPSSIAMPRDVADVDGGGERGERLGRVERRPHLAALLNRLPSRCRYRGRPSNGTAHHPRDTARSPQKVCTSPAGSPDRLNQLPLEQLLLARRLRVPGRAPARPACSLLERVAAEMGDRLPEVSGGEVEGCTLLKAVPDRLLARLGGYKVPPRADGKCFQSGIPG